MNSATILSLSVQELSERIRTLELSSTEVATSVVDRLEELQDELNTFVYWDRDLIFHRAAELDALAKVGDFAGDLHGIPLAVKDNFLTADCPSTVGSRVNHARGVPRTDSAPVHALRSNGALIVGKTNMHEWAYGATNEVSASGRTRNPWNPNRITGGSSGGSGAALAARIVPAALGSDTGGSIRIPAAACGVSGLKPSFGVHNLDGVLPLAWSFDVPGPMARTAVDLGLLLRAMLPASAVSSLSTSLMALDDLRIGKVSGSDVVVSVEVDEALDVAVAVLAEAGAKVDSAEVNNMAFSFDVWKVILHAEAAAYHTDLLTDQNDRYSTGVRTQLEAGRAIPAADYLQAQRFRREFSAQVLRLFDRFDVLLLPTLPVCAPPAGRHDLVVRDVPITAQDAMTRLPSLASFTGLPAVTVPCGFGDEGLPVGMSLIGRPGSDFGLVSLAARFQELTSWHESSPGLVTDLGERGG